MKFLELKILKEYSITMRPCFDKQAFKYLRRNPTFYRFIGVTTLLEAIA